MVKYETNASGAMLLLNLIQVMESISGSVVPLAMFYFSFTTLLDLEVKFCSKFLPNYFYFPISASSQFGESRHEPRVELRREDDHRPGGGEAQRVRQQNDHRRGGEQTSDCSDRKAKVSARADVQKVQILSERATTTPMTTEWLSMLRKSVWWLR